MARAPLEPGTRPQPGPPTLSRTCLVPAPQSVKIPIRSGGTLLHLGDTCWKWLARGVLCTPCMSVQWSRDPSCQTGNGTIWLIVQQQVHHVSAVLLGLTWLISSSLR